MTGLDIIGFLGTWATE